MESAAGAGPRLIRFALLISLLAIVGCGDPTDPVSSPSPADVSGLEEAVRPAAVTLLEAQGIEATSETTFDTGRKEFRWIDYRSEGEYAEIEAVEFVGEATRTSATVVFAELRYEAQSRSGGTPGSWTARVREPHERLDNPLSRMLPLTTPGPELGSLTIVSGGYFEALTSEADEVKVTSQETSDGGSLWTLTVASSGTMTTQLAYGIHPDGYLRSFDVSTEDPVSTTRASLREPARRVSLEAEFAALSDPDPIQPPEPGTPLDLDRFDLPSGFPTG